MKEFMKERETLDEVWMKRMED